MHPNSVYFGISVWPRGGIRCTDVAAIGAWQRTVPGGGRQYDGRHWWAAHDVIGLREVAAARHGPGGSGWSGGDGDVHRLIYPE